MQYIAEQYNRSRRTWLGSTIEGKYFIETESETVALEAFFRTILNKTGEYRLRSVVTFQDGTKDRKTVCELRK